MIFIIISVIGMEEIILQVNEILKKYKDKRGALIPTLTEVQKVYGYLPQPLLRHIAEELNIPSSLIYGIVSFYSFFSINPRGRHIIRVCKGTACYVKGGEEIINFFAKELKVEEGKITEDKRFSLETVRCLGACGIAPVIMIDSDVFGHVSLNNIRNILNEYK
jgi:NADH-quinone oxidoreductase E subunit